MTRVLLLGASGFVGGHVQKALEASGAHYETAPAPRMKGAGPMDAAAPERIARLFERFDVVVNAAGVPKPTGNSRDMLLANAVLPTALANAAQLSGCRLIHISSAAVQGRKATLDSSSETNATSPYSMTKAQGEVGAGRHPDFVTIYRPPGVHGIDRSATQQLGRLAKSRLAAVAAPGTANTPQALAQNVGSAAAFLALSVAKPPVIVHHPSEGLTTFSILSLLGGKEPSLLPASLTSLLIGAVARATPRSSRLNGVGRRLEILLNGQSQATSWLETQGWTPQLGHEAWEELGRALRAEHT